MFLADNSSFRLLLLVPETKKTDALHLRIVYGLFTQFYSEIRKSCTWKCGRACEVIWKLELRRVPLHGSGD